MWSLRLTLSHAKRPTYHGPPSEFPAGSTGRLLATPRGGGLRHGRQIHPVRTGKV
jgi:hypothetical protein